MSTRINITIDSGGLLDRNAQQTAANRQARVLADQRATAEAEGVERRAADRIAAGLDPLTGLPASTPSSASTINRLDQEPAANRRGGSIYVGNAWTFEAPVTERQAKTYVGSGDLSDWIELADFGIPNPMSWRDSRQASAVGSLVDIHQENIFTLPRPGWAAAKIPRFNSTLFGIVANNWYITTPGSSEGKFNIWIAMLNDTWRAEQFPELKSTHARSVDILPAGKDKGIAIVCNRYGWHDHWALSYTTLVIEDEDFGYDTASNLYGGPSSGTWAWNFYVFAEGTNTGFVEEYKTAIVTNQAVTSTATPTWVKDAFAPEWHGTMSNPDLGNFIDFQERDGDLPANFFRRLLLHVGTDIATFNFNNPDQSTDDPEYMINFVTFGPSSIFEDQSSWETFFQTVGQFGPHSRGGFYDGGSPVVSFLNTENLSRAWPDFEAPLNADQIRADFGVGSSAFSFYRGLVFSIRGKVTSPLAYYYVNNDFRESGNYGQPSIEISPDPDPRKLDGDEQVVNGWGFPTGGLPLEETFASATLPELVKASYFGYLDKKPGSDTVKRNDQRPRIGNTLNLPAAVQGSQTVDMHLFTDWGKRGLTQGLAAQAGFALVPPPPSEGG
jgi:hypothetical protein